MLSALFLLFRRVVAVLLVSAGLLVGVVGMSGTVVLAWLWARGQTTAAGDGRAAVGCLFALLLGAAALWSGGRLWPGRWSSAAPGVPTPASQRLRHPAWFAGGFLALVAVILWNRAAGATPVARAGFVLLGSGAVFLGLHVVIAVHELGHLLAAALLGRDLLLFQVGAGRRLGRVDLGGGRLRLEWRLWPSAGLVQAPDVRTAGYRGRTWAFVAAGPLAHAAVLAALAVWVWRANGGGLLPTAGGTGAGAALRLAGAFLLWPGATLLLGAILPQQASLNGQTYASDGRQLWRVPRLGADAVELIVLAGLLGRVERLWETGLWADARARLGEVLARFPGRVALSVSEAHYLLKGGEPLAAAETLAVRAAEGRAAGWPLPVRLRLAYDEAHARLRAGEPARARALCAEFLLGVTAPAERAEALDVLACVVTHYGHREMLAEANAWSAEMMALEPDVPTRQATRGAVLVELERMAEAEAMLAVVWACSPREVDAATAAFGLARVARSRGDRTGLRRWRRRARRFVPYASAGLVARIVGPEMDDAAAAPPRNGATPEGSPAELASLPNGLPST